MVKINKQVVKVVAGTLSASILTHSCVPYNSMYDDNLYKIDQQINELGKIAVPIRLGLESNQAAYLGLIQKLSVDIIKHPVIAKQFYNNPKLFLERYGYKGEINLDDDLLKLIMALGDDDINKAIKLGDASLFIALCNEKGLLTNSNEMYTNLKNQLDKQLLAHGFELPPVEEIQAGVAIALLITVLIALVVAVNVTINWTITDDIYSEGAGASYAKNRFKQFITEENPVLNIWFMKQKEDKNFVLVNEYAENQINKFVSEIKARNPKYFEKNSESEFRNLLKLNSIML